MVSHRAGVGVSFAPKHGVHAFFRKAKSEFNRCVGRALKGKGGSREARKAAFTQAAKSCRGSKAK